MALQNEDPLMSECLIYQLKPGKTDVGRLEGDKPCAIRLSGDSIGEEHCYFENNDGKVTLHGMQNAVTVCIVTPLYGAMLIVTIVLERQADRTWTGNVYVYLS